MTSHHSLQIIHSRLDPLAAIKMDFFGEIRSYAPQLADWPFPVDDKFTAVITPSLGEENSHVSQLKSLIRLICNTNQVDQVNKMNAMQRHLTLFLSDNPHQAPS